MNNLINERRLAELITEYSAKLSPANNYQPVSPYFSINSNPNHDSVPKMIISFYKIINPSSSEYNLALQWFENDPRTTLDSDGDLQITHKIKLHDCIIKYYIIVKLTNEEKQFLKDLGKLVPQTYTTNAVAC